MKIATVTIALSAAALCFSACTDQSDIESKAFVKPAAGARAAAAVTYYVAKGGTNNGPGTDPTKPWGSIQYAVNNAPGGSIIEVAEGIYAEVVKLNPTLINGTTQARTIIKNRTGQTPILDGTGLANFTFGAVFDLANAKFITVQGLRIINGSFFAFKMDGAQDITIQNCSTFNTKASGIFAQGSKNLTFRNNKIQKACQLLTRVGANNDIGGQECITVNTCSDFLIEGNEVWDITVNAQGGEGINARSGSTNGTITQNYVHDLFRVGLYCDGGGTANTNTNIRYYANKVYRTAGISVAGEIGGTLNGVYFYNNVIANSKSSGVTLQGIGSGKFLNVYFVNNTFYNNAQSGNTVGDITSFNINAGNRNIVIRNNIFYNQVANSKHSIYYNVPAGATNPYQISNNLFFNFKSSANTTGLSATTTSDVLTDPQLSGAATENFFPATTSPAINKGIVITSPGSTTPLFTTDYFGKARTGMWDMGAYEVR